MLINYVIASAIAVFPKDIMLLRKGWMYGRLTSSWDFWNGFTTAYLIKQMIELKNLLNLHKNSHQVSILAFPEIQTLLELP